MLKKRICILSHNSIIYDSRILKYISTLSKNNDHQIDVFGFFDKIEKVKLESSFIKVRFFSIKYNKNILIIRKYLNIIILIFLSFFFLFILNYLNFLNGHHFLFFGILLPCLLFILYKFKKKKIVRYLFLKPYNFFFEAINLISLFSLNPFINYIKEKITSLFIINKLKKNPPNIIHCHDFFMLNCAVILKKKFNSILIWDAHEIYEDCGVRNPSLSRLIRKKLTQINKFIDYFITINQSLANFYSKNYENLNNPFIIKNACEILKSEPYDGRLHAKCNLPTSQKICLFHGGVSKYRGLQILIEAIKYIDKSWTIVIIGFNNDFKTQLIRDSKKILKKNKIVHPFPIKFLNVVPQNELIKWVRGATIGYIGYENIHLNHLYCTPNKLWEYPTADVPIICPNYPELRKIINQYDIGWLMPQNFSSRVFAKLINQITDEEIKMKKRNCRSFVKEDNWEIYSKKILNFYDGIF